MALPNLTPNQYSTLIFLFSIIFLAVGCLYGAAGQLDSVKEQLAINPEITCLYTNKSLILCPKVPLYDPNGYKSFEFDLNFNISNST